MGMGLTSRLLSKIFLGTLGVFLCAQSHSQSLTVAADAWCPYNCEPTSEQPGYMVELLRSALKPLGMQPDYKLLPWSRTLVDAEQGKLGAAIAVNQEEAKQYKLIIGKEPLGVVNGCLFVSADSKVRYTSVDDLDHLNRVGTVGGVAYMHGFGKWVQRPQNKHKIVQLYGDDVTERRAQMLLMGRLDGIFETENVMRYTLNRMQLQDKIISAGCQQDTLIYVGFSPYLPNAAVLAAQLDAETAGQRKNGQLRTLLEKYGLKDWKRTR